MGDVKSSAPVTRRPYRSALRQEGARRTRRRIVLAATDLFAERGYTATSLDDIAATAGVARPTVTAAFGSKPILLKEVVDEALAGDDEPGPVAQRTWFQPVWEAATAGEVLAAYADVVTLIGSRAARLFEVVRRAADASPDVAELWGTAQHNRRAGAEMVIERIRRIAPEELLGDPGRATDSLWFLNDPAHYDTLVHHCNWSPEEFTTWLAIQMQNALLAPAEEGERQGTGASSWSV